MWQYPLGNSSRLSGEARLMFITLTAPLGPISDSPSFGQITRLALLKKYGFVPVKLVTDDLRSYGAAASDLGIAKTPLARPMAQQPKARAAPEAGTSGRRRRTGRGRYVWRQCGG